MRPIDQASVLSTGRSIGTEDLVDLLDGASKKRRYAYLAWLCFGSHHLYLRRPAVQLLFWLTVGGLLLWWLTDFFHIGAMVRRYNRRAAEKLIDGYRSAIEARYRSPVMLVPLPLDIEEEETRLPEILPSPPDPRPVFLAEPASARSFGVRSGAAMTLAGAFSAAIALYIFNPPSLYPRAELGDPFRTLAEVNVRARPSTASPILAKVEKQTQLTGILEPAASGGGMRWLRIKQGAHSGGYVAVQNLEPN